MIDERPDPLKPYRHCRLGFFLLAVGLVPVAVFEVLWLLGWLLRARLLLLWLEASGLDPLISTLTPWATLAGATVLWATWDNPSWRRRAGLLMTMCLVDVGCWFLDLGDPQRLGDHVWFRSQLGAALGWAQFALLASLSGDLLFHLGVENAEESSRSTRSLAATGFMLWMLVFLESADLQAGWPPRRNPRMLRHTELLWMGRDLIHAICLIQATALVVAAFRLVNQEVPRIEAEPPAEGAPERLTTSEPGDDPDLLATRPSDADRDRAPWM